MQLACVLYCPQNEASFYHLQKRIQKGELIYDILGLDKLRQREDVIEREVLGTEDTASHNFLNTRAFIQG